jgi:NADH-quinone oxidoreductase subunit L
MGIYLLARISLNMFRLDPASWGSTMLMIIGAGGILLAVSMALIQKDYKRLLSFHAISQVGYMILGIGTCTPIGVVGGLFHMINNTLYKCALFLTAGSVERQTGTTDLRKIGGLKAKMPITFTIFVVAALSISGVPFTNGFYSKEMVYAGAFSRNIFFYLAAAIGSVLTAASFLKLGYAAYIDKRGDASKVKEAPMGMLIPGGILAALCLFFGLGNAFPLREFIQPVLGDFLGGKDFAIDHFPFFHPTDWMVYGTLVALAIAWISQQHGIKKYGSGLKGADHIHYAPVMHQIYDCAEKRYFDPYEWAKVVGNAVGFVGFSIDKGIDFIYNKIIPSIINGISTSVRMMHNGSHVTYLAWSLAGILLVIIACMTGRL